MPSEYYDALQAPEADATTPSPAPKMRDNPLPPEVIDAVETDPLPIEFNSLVRELHKAEKAVKTAERPGQSRQAQFTARARMQRIRRALSAMQQLPSAPVITGNDFALQKEARRLNDDSPARRSFLKGL